MKILFAGGGTGGHFFPIIAIAEEIKQLAEEEKLIMPKMYLMSDDPYNAKTLFEHNIKFVGIPAGKIRHYGSIRNFFDWFKTCLLYTSPSPRDGLLSRMPSSA